MKPLNEHQLNKRIEYNRTPEGKKEIHDSSQYKDYLKRHPSTKKILEGKGSAKKALDKARQ